MSSQQRGLAAFGFTKSKLGKRTPESSSQTDLAKKKKDNPSSSEAANASSSSESSRAPSSDAAVDTPSSPVADASSSQSSDTPPATDTSSSQVADRLPSNAANKQPSSSSNPSDDWMDKDNVMDMKSILKSFPIWGKTWIESKLGKADQTHVKESENKTKKNSTTFAHRMTFPVNTRTDFPFIHTIKISDIYKAAPELFDENGPLVTLRIRGEFDDNLNDVEENVVVTDEVVGVLCQECREGYVRHGYRTRTNYPRTKLKLINHPVIQPWGHLRERLKSHEFGDSLLGPKTKDVKKLRSEIEKGDFDFKANKKESAKKAEMTQHMSIHVSSIERDLMDKSEHRPDRLLNKHCLNISPTTENAMICLIANFLKLVQQKTSVYRHLKYELQHNMKFCGGEAIKFLTESMGLPYTSCGVLDQILRSIDLAVTLGTYLELTSQTKEGEDPSFGIALDCGSAQQKWKEYVGFAIRHETQNGKMAIRVLSFPRTSRKNGLAMLEHLQSSVSSFNEKVLILWKIFVLAGVQFPVKKSVETKDGKVLPRLSLGNLDGLGVDGALISKDLQINQRIKSENPLCNTVHCNCHNTALCPSRLSSEVQKEAEPKTVREIDRLNNLVQKGLRATANQPTLSEVLKRKIPSTEAGTEINLEDLDSSDSSPIDVVLKESIQLKSEVESTETWIYKGQETSIKLHDLLTASCQVDHIWKVSQTATGEANQFKGSKPHAVPARPMHRWTSSLNFCDIISLLPASVEMTVANIIDMGLCDNPRRTLMFTAHWVLKQVRSPDYWLYVAWNHDVLSPLCQYIVQMEAVDSDPELMLNAREICMESLKMLIERPTTPGTSFFKSMISRLSSKTGPMASWSKCGENFELEVAIKRFVEATELIIKHFSQVLDPKTSDLFGMFKIISPITMSTNVQKVSDLKDFEPDSVEALIDFFTKPTTFHPNFSLTDPLAKTGAPSVSKQGLVDEDELRVGLRTLQTTIFHKYLGVNKATGRNWTLEEVLVNLSRTRPPWFAPGTAIRRVIQYYRNQFVSTADLERQMSVFKLIDTPLTQGRRDDTVERLLRICKDAEDSMDFDCALVLRIFYHLLQVDNPSSVRKKIHLPPATVLPTPGKSILKDPEVVHKKRKAIVERKNKCLQKMKKRIDELGQIVVVDDWENVLREYEELENLIDEDEDLDGVEFPWEQESSDATLVDTHEESELSCEEDSRQSQEGEQIKETQEEVERRKRWEWVQRQTQKRQVGPQTEVDSDPDDPDPCHGFP